MEQNSHNSDPTSLAPGKLSPRQGQQEAVACLPIAPGAGSHHSFGIINMDFEITHG